MKFAKFLRAPILMNICEWPTASLIWNVAHKFSITSFASILHNSTADSEVSIKITTMSLVLNVLRFFVFSLLWRHHSPATEVKMWSCATIDAVYAQRSCLTVVQLTFTEWRFTLKHKILYKLFLLAMSERKIQNLSRGKCIHAWR